MDHGCAKPACVFSLPLLRPIFPSSRHYQNECVFCSNGHAVCARLGGQNGASKLVRDRNADHIEDERIRSICQWALSFPDKDSEAIRNPPPMSPRDACELLGSVLHVIYKVS